VAASVVVGRILLAGDQLLGMEELLVGPGADLIWKNPKFLWVFTSSFSYQ